jgi:hypothetical protein
LPGPEEADNEPLAETRGEPPRTAEIRRSDLDLERRRKGEGEEKDLLSPSAPAKEFDFEVVYAKYPRKEGKADGMRAAKRKIKSDEQYQKLLIAVENYAKSTTVLEGYVLLFSTFINGRWLDYVNGPIVKAVPRNGHIGQHNIDEEIHVAGDHTDFFREALKNGH